jgi:hypothetical protein
MKARIAGLAALFTVSAALAAGADPQLINLVMPDAQVMAGVNVEQAKTTPFGQYVLAQIQPQSADLQNLAELTGFDPRRDVRELLVASPGSSDPKTGLALARGSFEVVKIAAGAALAKAKVEKYRGATLITDPKGTASFAFPDNTLVVAGTPDMVRAALDRRGSTASPISAALATKVNQLSTSQDAWFVSLVSPSSLKSNGPRVPGMTNQDAFQKVDQFNGGVKFGSNVVVSLEALAQTAQDASSLAGVLQFLANLAQSQSGGDPTAAALAKSLTVNTQGQTVKVGLSMPYDQFENLVKPKRPVRRAPKKV